MSLPQFQDGADSFQRMQNAWAAQLNPLLVKQPTGFVTQTIKAAYTLRPDDATLLVDASAAAFSLTLPLQTSLPPGTLFTLIKVDTGFNVVTVISGNAKLTTVATQGEVVTLLADGQNWRVSSRTIPSVKTAYTPTYAGAGLGTITNKSAFWKRIGDCAYVEFFGRAGVTSSSSFIVDIPLGLAVDSTKMGAVIQNVVGTFVILINQNLAGANNLGIITYDSGFGTNVLAASISATSTGFNEANSNAFIGSNNSFAGYFTVPITGWSG